VSNPEDAEAFEWDDDGDERGNTAHLAESRDDRPSILWWEVEEVFENGPLFVQNKKEGSGDWKMLGLTEGGRRLTVIVEYNEVRRTLRPITGWDRTSEEQARYGRYLS
jgi:hypothetical protein